MTSLLTNASAQTALRTLRSVQSNLQETQDRISTGLKVRSPKENAAFFLVAQTVKGDVAVLEGLKDNLTLGVNVAKTATAGLTGITDDINQIQTALTTAQTGTALPEVQFAISQVVEQIEGQIDATSFNGVNLLSGSDTTTLTTTITRNNGSFELSTFTLQGQDLDSTRLAGVATAVYSQPVAEAQFDALYRAFNSGFADRLDVNGDGSIDLTQGGPDDIPTTSTPTNPDSFRFFGTDDDIAFLNSIGIAASNLGQVATDGTQKDVIEITSIGGAIGAPTGPLAPAGAAAPLDYIGSKVAGGPTAFATVGDLLTDAVFSDANLREYANDSGFRAVARQIEVSEIGRANVQAGFVLADTLIARINIASTVVGVFDATLDSRQNFLADLTDSLDLGVASLIEADLSEESSRLQSIQVQEQLATQALSIANQRPQSVLALFQ
jgi:flagellin